MTGYLQARCTSNSVKALNGTQSKQWPQPEQINPHPHRFLIHQLSPNVGHFPSRTFPLTQTINLILTLTLTLTLTLLTPLLTLTLTKQSRGKCPRGKLSRGELSVSPESWEKGMSNSLSKLYLTSSTESQHNSYTSCIYISFFWTVSQNCQHPTFRVPASTKYRLMF